jgi:hypothetical protein
MKISRAYLNGVQVVAGSNPFAPTIKKETGSLSGFFFYFGGGAGIKKALIHSSAFLLDKSFLPLFISPATAFFRNRMKPVGFVITLRFFHGFLEILTALEPFFLQTLIRIH